MFNSIVHKKHILYLWKEEEERYVKKGEDINVPKYCT